MGSPRVVSKLLYRSRIGKFVRRSSLVFVAAHAFLFLGILGAIRWEFAHFYESAANTTIGFVADFLLVFAYFSGFVHFTRKHVAVQWVYADCLVTKTRSCRAERRFPPETKFYFFRIIRNWVALVAPGGFSVIGIDDPVKFRKILEREGYASVEVKLAWEIGVIALCLLPLVAATLKPRYGEAPFWISLALLALSGVVWENRGRSMKAATKWYRERLFGRPRWPAARRAAAAFVVAIGVYAGQIAVGYESPRDRRVDEIKVQIDRGEFAAARRAIDAAAPEMTGARFKNLRAWFLTTAPETGLRNYGLAVASAKEALKLNSHRQILDTLACAQMGSGDRDEALRIAKKAKLKDRIDLFATGKLCRDEKMEKAFADRAIASVKKD